MRGLAASATCVAAFATATPIGAQSDDARAQPLPHPPILIDFDGLPQLTGVARRQRMLSQQLEYTLLVDDAGIPVRCDLARDYRRNATEIALCRPLLDHMRFEPARSADGKPVAGRYSGTITFRMWMGKDGHLDRRPRDNRERD